MALPGQLLRPVTRVLDRADSTTALREGVCEAAVSAGYDYAVFAANGERLAAAGDVPDGLPDQIEVHSLPDGSHPPPDREPRSSDTAKPSQPDSSVDDSTVGPRARRVDHGNGLAAALPVRDDERCYGVLVVGPATDVEETDLEQLTGVGAAVGTGFGKLTESRARETLQQTLRRERRQFEKLHSVAAQMVECENPDSIYHLAIDAAENILDFDICGIDVAEGDYLVPKVTSTGMDAEDSQRLPTDEGIAGRTFQENETIIVDDVEAHPDGKPANPDYKSILSVPIEDIGLFQAGSEQRGAFSPKDAELVELLLAHVSQTLQRLRSQDALRESEQKYRTLIEQSHDAVTIYKDGSYVFANQRATELFGRGQDELLECSAADVVHPDDLDQLEQMSGPGVDVGSQRTFEARIQQPDGQLRHCEFSTTVITYREGRAMLASIRDITERKERERDLERQNERLDEFASVVSHDLRSPINVARGSVDLAQQQGDPEHLERAEDALERMETLVEDILDLARQGKLVDETETVQIREAAEEAWQTVDSPTATLDVDLEAHVEADPVRLRELFENLFRNAVEHAGDDVDVSVSRCEDGFQVVDDGPGLPEDVQSDVFERGFTTTEDGTGFGLAIVRNIAEAHDWDIDTCSDGDGACFAVTGCRPE
jgi:PAS domain S-box-containing protein